MQTVAPKTWYVYTYAYPDGTVFYVGKGCHARIEEHEREAQRGCSCEKCCTIRKIWDSGKPIRKRIVYETLTEQEALEHENYLINTIYGLENLTNRNSGVTYFGKQRELKERIELKPDDEAAKPTIRELRMEAGLTIPQLAALSRVKYFTIGHMEDGKAIAQPAIRKIAEVLSERLQREITVEDLSIPNGVPDIDHSRPTLRELRMEAGLTIPQLAALSGVKYFTIGHMEDGKVVSYITAQRVLDALGKKLQRKITAEQIDKLNIKY